MRVHRTRGEPRTNEDNEQEMFALCHFAP